MASVTGKQWKRVTGPNLCPENAVRAQRNKSTLTSPIFLKACETVGIEPTKRQASKWNNKKGKAYNAR